MGLASLRRDRHAYRRAPRTFRGRSGAGEGTSRRRSPRGLGPGPDQQHQAHPDPTGGRSKRSHYGELGRSSVGPSGPWISSHRTRVRKASQRFVSLKTFNTEATNQRFRQSRAKVLSSNQWIITQPKLRLPDATRVEGRSVRRQRSCGWAQAGARSERSADYQDRARRRVCVSLRSRRSDPAISIVTCFPRRETTE
jgi:hypothetical protein